MNYTITVAACSTKAVKFTLSVGVCTGGLAKSQFSLVARQKKREPVKNNQTRFEICPMPFSKEKNEENFYYFALLGPLFARVALKNDLFTSRARKESQLCL